MISLKQYDTGRAIEQVLSIGGVPIDLTGTTVNLLWAEDGVLLYNRTAEIVSAAAGSVKYQPIAQDVARAGDFELEWKVVYPDASRVTVPTESRVQLRLHPAIA